jgi:hypothetical protein
VRHRRGALRTPVFFWIGTQPLSYFFLSFFSLSFFSFFSVRLELTLLPLCTTLSLSLSLSFGYRSEAEGLGLLTVDILYEMQAMAKAAFGPDAENGEDASGRIEITTTVVAHVAKVADSDAEGGRSTQEVLDGCIEAARAIAAHEGVGATAQEVWDRHETAQLYRYKKRAERNEMTVLKFLSTADGALTTQSGHTTGRSACN